MKSLSTYVLLAAMAALTVSCKKDSENAPKTKEELLTAKKWRLSAQTSTATINNQAITSDNYAMSPACERDDFVQFNANKTAVFDEGATKCDLADPQNENGTWDFNSDRTKLNLTSPDLGGLIISFDIVTLDANTLSIRTTQDFGGLPLTINATYKSF